MQNSDSIKAKRPWELLLASYIAVNMAFFNLSNLFGSVMRLVHGPYTFLSMLFVVLGFTMVAVAFLTAYWTVFRMHCSIAGYWALTLLTVAQMVLYPTLHETAPVAFMEIGLACFGILLYVAPLILLVRVRQTLRR